MSAKNFARVSLSGLCGITKGFCRAKFWVKFPFWRGAVRGEVFGEVSGEVFGEVFGFVFLGHSELTLMAVLVL